MNRWLLKILKISIIIIGMIVLILCVKYLPYRANATVEMFPEVAYLKYPILIGIYITCIPFYIGVYHAFKLLQLTEKDDSFTMGACSSLKIISICAISIIGIYIGGIFYLNAHKALPPGLVLLGLIIIFTSFIISVFSLVLKVLLMKVIEIKKENELTI